MKYKCYLCGRSIQTNDIFATITTNIENCGGDIIKTLLDEKICSWCSYRFDYWRKVIQEKLKEEKPKKSK